MKKLNNTVEDYKKNICIIEKDSASNTLILYDCNNNKKKYNQSINSAFREHCNCNCIDMFRSVVWILTGKSTSNSQDETYLQIGRNSTIENMLSNDINRDTNVILTADPTSKNKYANLSNTYNILTFSLIDIDTYLNDDTIFKSLVNFPTENSDLQKAYYSFKAAYAEGKLAQQLHNDNSLWNRSGGIDGYIYDYFNNL